MPELPEVHTITTDLKNTIVGFTIAQSWVSKGYYKIKNPSEFSQKVASRKITDVRRIAKNILIELDSKDYIHIHLAMTGRVFIIDPAEIKGKKAHVIFHLKNGGQNKVMTFTDVRTFGKVEILSPLQIVELEKKYGYEPIDLKADSEGLYDSLKNKKTIIKNILMDQSIIAGLGNIYATEALFLANVNPKTKMNKLSKEQFIALLDAAKDVLEQGIKHRGSTLPDKMYVDIWGNPGSQQDFFNVYMQQICPKCKGKVSFDKIAGRGTYFCQNCQPLQQ